jgi:peroxiredoxin
MQLPVTTASAAGQGGSANRWGASVAVVARYNVAGRGGVLPGTIQVAYWDGDLTVNREYARVGILKLPTRSFRIALVDQNSTARFDDFMHEQEEPAKVTVLVDRNNDGLFDLKREVFDAAMPFRVGGATYRVTAIDPRGMQMTLRRTEKKLRSAISPASLKVGATIIDFDVETLDNKSVAFPDDYKGKIVLLDFWAMWCPPCLEEIPNIVRVYEQYKKEGFDILGVSLDKENQNKKLEEFLKENEMPWKQVYDGGFWKAEVAELFKINSIPMAYLVDGDTGKILAMGDALRGEGLAAEVEKALDRKKGRRN